jgi:hypothetical protein
METGSVANIEGAWIEPEFESSLIQRCRDNWSVPVSNLSNYVLATFARQRMGRLVVREAKRRIELEFLDGSELYDEELSNAIAELSSKWRYRPVVDDQEFFRNDRLRQLEAVIRCAQVDGWFVPPCYSP